MMFRPAPRVAFCLTILSFSPVVLQAQEKAPAQPPAASAEARATNKGQAKLDEAFDLRAEARSLDDLRKVIDFCDKALELGLDDENARLANNQIAATAFERASEMLKNLGRTRLNAAGLKRLQSEMQKDLRRATQADPKMAEAWLMLARVEDREKALQAIEKAISLYSNNPAERSKAYILKAGLLEDNQERIAALRQAIADDTGNQDAWQAVIQLQQADKKYESALADAKKLLETEPTNMFGIAASVTCLINLEKIDEAIAFLSDKIKDIPNEPLLVRQRGELYSDQNQIELAIADLNKAIELNPRDEQALLIRARTHLKANDIDKAEKDVEDALVVQPDSIPAIYLRAGIAAQQKRLADAIRDMQRLVRALPDNADFLIRLASFFQADDRPKKAIELLTTVIDSKDKPDWEEAKSDALRARGDALLSVGEHLKAIKDYEGALKLLTSSQQEARSGLLNNLAWVLATSPNDEVRDGQRSLRLAKEACELTKFKEAHILSTLASAYAELGNFEEAVQWSEKAVQTGREGGNEQLEQLEKELESYKQKKPWREKQETSEKKSPVPSAGGVDT